MFVSIDLCLVPIGVGTSLSPYIKECIEVIKNEGLNYELGANGTAIEGDWDEVFECVRKCHEKIHSKLYAGIQVIQVEYKSRLA